MSKNKYSGFTLVEVMVVIGIIGVISTITFIAFNEARVQARDQFRIAQVNKIAELFNKFEFDNGYVPRCNRGTLIEEGLPPAPPAGDTANDCRDYDAIVDLLEKNMGSMPHDPFGPGDDRYFFVYDDHVCDTTGDGNSDTSKVILFAQLENSELSNKAEVCGKVGTGNAGGNNEGYYNYHNDYSEETDVYVVEIDCYSGNCN